MADPKAAPANPAGEYARPDDTSGFGPSWRHILLEYNESGGSNPLGLFPAWQLYENDTYQRFVDRFGLQKVFILSAGWGLLHADFLTPYYDITFSQSAENYKRRRKAEFYQDFRMLPERTDEDIYFFGGKDYIPLFCSLTGSIKSKKVLFYNSAHPPLAKGCTLEKFDTMKRTNWHYECADAFMRGKLGTR